MSKFDDFKNEILTGVKGLALGSLTGFVDQMKSDTQQFLQAQEQHLIEWTNDLGSGEIDEEEFEFLVKGQIQLFEMHALTVAGITAAQIQHFRDAVTKIVVDAAIKVFIPV